MTELDRLFTALRDQINIMDRLARTAAPGLEKDHMLARCAARHAELRELFGIEETDAARVH